VGSFWQAIEEFCLSAKEKPKSLDQIYQALAAAPYGIKPGAIPVMLAAVLLYHQDNETIAKRLRSQHEID